MSLASKSMSELFLLPFSAFHRSLCSWSWDGPHRAADRGLTSGLGPWCIVHVSLQNSSMFYSITFEDSAWSIEIIFFCSLFTQICTEYLSKFAQEPKRWKWMRSSDVFPPDVGSDHWKNVCINKELQAMSEPLSSA